MCGYSAGNAMTESKLRVAHLHLVCRENQWRLPPDLACAPHAALRAGALRGEEFGTRHDKAGSLMAARYLTDGAKAVEAEGKTLKLKKPGKTDRLESAQMIYDFQVILPGARFYGSVDFLDLTELELAALASAFYYSTAAQRDRVRMSVGGKASVGFGSLSVELRGSVRAQAAEHVASTEIVGPDQADRAAAYADHLRRHREEILGAVREAAS
jgi:CRISPR/Cas system CSM-associated protein Csm3 (group 7 of RAMP superfamily)